MIKDGKPYKSEIAKLLDMLLTNSLPSFAWGKCIDFNDFADAF